MRKISSYLIFVVFLFSCSSAKIADSEIQKLNGKYDANSIQSSTNRNENFIKLLNRQLIRDSLNYEVLPYFKFEIKVKNKNHLIINKINEEDKIVNSREYKFRRKSDYIILKNKNVKIFLDLKLKDIPNTVYKAIKSLKDVNPDYLTIHASGGLEMMRAAKKAQSETNKKLKIFQLLLSNSYSFLL